MNVFNLTNSKFTYDDVMAEVRRRLPGCDVFILTDKTESGHLYVSSICVVWS